ncbi:DUF2922 domain-containing protein [Romboutsia sp. CE17]|uniref:DUF2922 domain-containing protein n=1 Tax=Romboutsia sp. CE17 TaxID=2724150 RepID=UPI001442CA02|nr:DUF2922 domain-containing protein [Romboutsia sp. CE17]QJA09088.1 DUF2922 domain-containing protein [Romboutsia sp. CE17]
METTKSLVMTFLDEGDSKVSLTVQDPRDNITEAEIKSAMELVISKNIFDPNGLDLVSAVDAKIVVKETTPYDLVIG